MSHAVYKYPLKVDDLQAIDLPAGAQLLSVQVQGDQPCLWALVDPNADTVKRHIRIAGTGHPIDVSPRHLAYIATFQLYSGKLVFHAFEVLS